LSLFESFVENYLNPLFIFLENFFEKSKSPKYCFLLLFKPMQAILQRDICKMIYKAFLAKGMFEKYIFQKLFCKVYSLNLKGLPLKSYFYLVYANKPFG
jgi:hypothetical protein